jgi:hypothetical protein
MVVLYVADQCFNNGWSPSTIMKKFKGECDIDINKSMNSIDWISLERFCKLIATPQRENGGYEESREMLFQYLFGMSSEEAKADLNSLPVNWLTNVVKASEEYERQQNTRNA